MRRQSASTVLAACFALSMGALAGCDDDGAFEEAGEEIDEGLEDAGDEIEDLGDEIEDATDDIDDDIDDVDGAGTPQ